MDGRTTYEANSKHRKWCTTYCQRKTVKINSLSFPRAHHVALIPISLADSLTIAFVIYETTDTEPAYSAVCLTVWHFLEPLLCQWHTYRKSAPKTRTGKTGADFWRVWDTIWYQIFFRYQFLVTNRTCSIFVLVYGTGVLIRVFGADFWHMSHGN